MSNSPGGSDNCRGGKINAQKKHNSGYHCRNRDRPYPGLVDGLIKTLMAAVALWWMVFLLLIGMEEEKDAESIQRDSKAPQRKHRAA